MYEKNLQMSSFESNSRHVDTWMHFKIITDLFQQLPVGHPVRWSTNQSQRISLDILFLLSKQIVGIMRKNSDG